MTSYDLSRAKTGQLERVVPGFFVMFPEPALPLSSGAGNGRILGADQKDRSLWERDCDRTPKF